MLKKIDTSAFTFERLRTHDCLYVDKTEYVYNLVHGDLAYFLSRPRRFGKSLLLSTLDAYFSGRKDLFKGLAIEQLDPGEWETYPIIRLDMAEVADANADAAMIAENLVEALDDNARRLQIPLRGHTPARCLKNLITDITDRTGKQAVILIDEYDKPILSVIGRPQAEPILEELRNFYQIIKSANAKERFVFITGVTKFAHTSIFSGANNPTDLTMMADYATMLGYTHEELEANFGEYIDETAQKIGLSRQKLLDGITEWYDGFRFHGKAPSVFNPVSVGKFFVNREFSNYWYDTGSPKFLLEVAKKTPFAIEQYRNTPLEYTAFDKYEINDLDPLVVAVQTGYLTIKKTETDFDYSTLYYVDYPNKEIRDAFRSYLFEACASCKSMQRRDILKGLVTALKNGDVDGFMCPIQSLLAGLPWGNLGQDREDPVAFYEGYFRNLLALAFAIIDMRVAAEERTSDGVIDLVAHYADRTFILELKAGREQEADRLLDEALNQITKKDYAAKYRWLSQNITCIGVVFDVESRRLVKWRAEK